MVRRLNAGMPSTSTQSQPSSNSIQQRISELQKRRAELIEQQKANELKGGAIKSRTRARSIQIEQAGVTQQLLFLEKAQKTPNVDQEAAVKQAVKVGEEGSLERARRISEGLSRSKRPKNNIPKGYKVKTTSEGRLIYNEQGTLVAGTKNGAVISGSVRQYPIITMKPVRDYANIPKPQTIPTRKAGTPNTLQTFTALRDISVQKLTPITNKAYTGIIRAKKWLLPPPETIKKSSLDKKFNELLGNKSINLPQINKPFDFAAEQTLNIGGTITKGLTNIGIISPQTASIPAPISRTQAKSFISTAYMFSAFEPLMRTATSQQSVYAGKVVEVEYKGQIVKMTEAEAKALKLPVLTREQAALEFSLASPKRQEEILKKAFENRVYLDKSALSKDLSLAQKFLKEAGIKDITKQKALLESVFKTPKTQEIITKPLFSNSKFSGKGLYERTGQQMYNIPGVKTSPGQVQIAELKGITIPEVTLSNKKLTKPIEDVSPIIANTPRSITTPKIDTSTRQITYFFPASNIKTDSLTKQEVITVPKLDTKTTQSFTPRFDTPTLQTPKITTPTIPGGSGGGRPTDEIIKEKPTRFRLPNFPIRRTGIRGSNLFGISIRSRGRRFKSIGISSTSSKALQIGRTAALKTPGIQQIKLTSIKGTPRTPTNIKGFKRKKGEGIIFEELKL